MTITITDLEFAYLCEIARSPYLDGYDRDDVVGCPVWSWCPNDRLMIGRRAAGVASSLVKKGLAHVDDYGDDDSTIAMTAAGWDAMVAERDRRTV